MLSRLAVAVVAGAALIGGTIVGVQVGDEVSRRPSVMVAAARSGPAGPSPTVSPVPSLGTTTTTSPDPDPEPEPTVDRAARGVLRSAPPSAAAVPNPGHPQRPGAGKPSTSVGTGISGTGTRTRTTCVASYYNVGKITASGEPFDPTGFTAAHRTLPFNTRVRVTDAASGRSVVVRINDRGPYVVGRCLDLSTAAFHAIASESAGVATVSYDVLG